MKKYIIVLGLLYDYGIFPEDGSVLSQKAFSADSLEELELLSKNCVIEERNSYSGLRKLSAIAFIDGQEDADLSSKIKRTLEKVLNPDED